MRDRLLAAEADIWENPAFALPAAPNLSHDFSRKFSPKGRVCWAKWDLPNLPHPTSLPEVTETATFSPVCKEAIRLLIFPESI
jgi:hypothetical protein